jgi:uncharacterized membrane protein
LELFVLQGKSGDQTTWQVSLVGAVFLLSALSMAASYEAYRDILLLTVFLLASTAFVVLLRRRSERDLDRVFAAVIWALAISLLLSETLVSPNLLGFDVHEEFFTFLQVSAQGSWNPNVLYTLFRPNYGSVLSITILPLIIQSLSGASSDIIFKFVFPIVFSLVPVLLYKIYRRLLEPEMAFVSVFLFISYPSFYFEMIGLIRQEVAEVILAGILLLLLQKLQSRGVVATILILTFGLVVSHYSLAFIYVSVLALSFCYYVLLKRSPKPAGELIILVGIVLTFSWYAFVSQGSVVTSLAQFGTIVSQSMFLDFFNPAARPGTVSVALGLAPLTGTFHNVNRILQYAIQFILVLGFLHLTRKRNKSLTEKSMYPLMTIGLVLIGAIVVVPNFADFGLNLTRTYHIALIFAAPFFAYGMAWLESTLSKAWSFLPPRFPRGAVHIRYRALIAGVLLFSYLLFNIGWVYAVSMEEPYSYVLDSQRMMYSPSDWVKATFYGYYVAPEDVVGSVWLKSYAPRGSYVCADFMSGSGFLVSYAGRLPEYAQTCEHFLDINDTPYGNQVLQSQSFVYLSVLNSRYGVWPELEAGGYSLVDLPPRESIIQNQIYSNGGSVIL